jgi:L-ribulose-5-phosphate 3-epimerase
MFKIGYNTNGFTSHSLLSTIDIMGSLGYDSIAITIDHHSLNPWDDNLDLKILEVKKKLEKYQMSSIVETGARFLLDPWVKHEPTLISRGKKKRDFRIKFIEKCLYIASCLGSDAVSIWSGNKKADVDDSQAWEWLIAGCCELSKKACDYGVYIGFEPEPGMLLENLEQYSMLKKEVDHDFFRLTLDLGHAFITEKSVPDSIFVFKDDIVNIHLEDMKKKRHSHLFFGEGDMDFQNIFQALGDIKYNGQVNIELSRHSHKAVETAKNAFNCIQTLKSNP